MSELDLFCEGCGAMLGVCAHKPGCKWLAERIAEARQEQRVKVIGLLHLMQAGEVSLDRCAERIHGVYVASGAA